MATSGNSSEKDRSEIVIDGRQNTIALSIAHLLIGLFPNDTVRDLLNAILDALTQPEFDYWGEVKDEVMLLVGQYINEHNINQVEVYQEDLQTLMRRYNDAPVDSDGTYPDKNQQAAALSTSIITHRYLIEAAVLPQSMILHFEDISSIHIVVLKDAAETYSFEGYPPSQWWVDLDKQLEHYIAYAEYLEESLRTWRISVLTCETYTSGNYVVFMARDGVTGEESECRELEGTTGCENHCANFVTHKSIEVEKFLLVKTMDVISAWKELKQQTEEIIGSASGFYDPRNEK
ncbi:hypothetical protein SK128_026713 [Halocaridina rubra]|uniref:Uncharacterized protein n=1 Tax=Halocaridina rubra TaxID=373956 RepID=A0AAN8WIT4_HALRR